MPDSLGMASSRMPRVVRQPSAKSTLVFGKSSDMLPPDSAFNLFRAHVVRPRSDWRLKAVTIGGLGSAGSREERPMRRSTALSSVLTLVLIGMLGFVPGVLAKQDATPIPDPAPSFEDIIVTCDGQACRPVDGMQTYNVEFNAAAYVPEKTYDEAIVVLVLEGQLAFRVQTGDVIFDPVGIGGPGASHAVKILKTDITVPFGGTPSTALTQPQYQDLGGTMTDAECSRPPLTNLCRLDPAKFADQQTFVLLEKDD